MDKSVNLEKLVIRQRKILEKSVSLVKREDIYCTVFAQFTLKKAQN